MNAEQSHFAAMTAYEKALKCRAAGDHGLFQNYAILALQHESRAAFEYENAHGEEPTRSVLFRSAATIAIEAGEYEEAIALAGAGLSKRGPLTSELVSLVKDAEFRRNLQANSQRISDETLRLSLDGGAVGFGYVPYPKFQHRIDALSKMIKRTFDRLNGVEFSDSIRGKDQIAIFLGTPIASSFAVDVKIGEIQQTEFPWRAGKIASGDVLSEIVRCMKAFEDGDLSDLVESIQDESYRRNFAELGRQIIPDGNDVTVVTLESNTGEEERNVVRLKISRKGIRSLFKPVMNRFPRSMEVVGFLRGARQPNDDSSFVEVLDKDGRFHKISVAEELMADIVRPLWDKRVTANIFKKGNHWELEHMAPAEDSD